MWKHEVDQVIPKYDVNYILEFCHSGACGGNFGTQRTIKGGS